ncbi:MAG: serine hydrolase [Bacteroidota bacterium]|nr:serine hydrolase [Bacteroidota bacterium]MDP4251179.1 serine hydrolase [Bacteroidota bacterium]
MKFQKSILLIFLTLLLTGIRSGAQPNNMLPFSDPESQGVASTGILHFLEAAGKSRNELHGFVFLRHGNVISEGWWDPYSASLKHTLYSTSKSFTATAVGFAVSEKKLNLSDKVISFFPDDLPDTVSAWLSALTVKDLLTMSGGQDPEPTVPVVSKESNWVKAFLAWPIVHQPGTHFLYNSLGSFMLSAIVQKVTGEKIIDYLRPRLFEPLGIEGEDWETSPRGVNTGGWGLRLKTDDMAKFGQLFLQKGKWNGKELLPASWIAEASTEKIIQHPDMPQSKRDSSDWEQGYCYQMWRCRHNAYRGDGAFGQFIIVMPDEDAVIAITAETPDMQDELNLVWKYLLPAMHPAKLSPDKKDRALLQKTLSGLSLPKPAKTVSSSLENSISGKTYRMETNEKRIGDMSFAFTSGKCLLTLKTDTATYNLSFGLNDWQKGETARLGPTLLSSERFNSLPFSVSQVAGIYRWADAHTLELTLRYVESPHTETTVCHFDGNKLSVVVQNSFDFGKKKTELSGERDR